MSVLLGTSAYDAPGDAGRRQAEALRTWTALEGVHPVNLQWADGVYAVEGFDTRPLLHGDTRSLTRGEGPRKPFATEVFDRLAELAAERGCRWFAYANADVRVTPAAIERVVADGREAYALARTDFEPATGADLGVVTTGTDAFVITPGWWRANRHRFRAYPLGEPVWDNVYTAIVLAHSDGALLNREPLLRHERHPASDWQRSPLARYVWLLAALDRPYFSLWAQYWERLAALRAAHSGEDAEEQLRREAFRYDPGAGDRVVQAARAARARLRYAAWRARP